MDEISTAGRRKRPSPADDDGLNNNNPPQKRVRFPKGKKMKNVEEVVDIIQRNEDIPSDVKDPQLVAKERSLLRAQNNAKLLEEENVGMLSDISIAEELYEDNETFVDDGVQIEPFNLSKEREEGYFDTSGNYVEYITDKDVKDAWLDSVDDGPKFTKKSSLVENVADQIADLSSKDIGKMKRRIADALEPGETVLRALRRLKGSSNNRKEKMSEETKAIFDQLTEDAMKLMENGDYNIYDEQQEVFEREAAGYEKLAQARIQANLNISGDGEPNSVSNGNDTVTDDGNFDMFAEDENANSSLASNNPSSESETVLDSYVYDESSGYYYSSSLGYYYDPSSGLYCYAATGQWYTYNQETGNYDEVQETVPNSS
jgi:CD2 antigen cytoplasmic tail-binding protein 2